LRHYAKKKWGQNFLADTNLLRKIVNSLELKPTDRFLEIGPGEGALTERILLHVDRLAAIEIDSTLVEHLKTVQELKDCAFIHGDVLCLELDELPFETPVRVVGNIPYNITSPILFWLIEQRKFWSDATIMVQKEMAERLTAKVGTKAYSRLTVMVGLMLNVKLRFTIAPEVFVPRPKVQSAIIHLTQRQNPLVSDRDHPRLEILVRAAFQKRRKMLSNSLKGYNIDPVVKKRINFTRRPETLSIKEFVELV
jgi:16S rRNA (adenine1518-N6/adenine1519-N6)-dimethyltransferase